MSIGVCARLSQLGLALPPVNPSKGIYVPAVRSGDLVFVAGQIPMVDGELIATGTVGEDLSTEQAAALSRQCALSALAAINTVASTDAIERVVKVLGYVASAPGFTDQMTVVAGAVDLFTTVFGQRGVPACSAVGVAILPLNAPVEIEVTVAIRENAIDQS